MAWRPMKRIDNDEKFEWNPALPIEQRADECWHNGRYQCLVKYVGNSDTDVEPDDEREGMLHLSIHSHDRGPMRNWRHLQQIKNEVCGELRTAVEIFPPEDKLVDTANEFHLWVLPSDADIGFGLGHEPLVSDDEIVQDFNNEAHQGHQEPWEDGLTTGRSEHSDKARANLRKMKEESGLRPPRIKEV